MTVVSPGEVYDIYMINDRHYGKSEILSIDEHWMEIATEHNKGLFRITVIPISSIKYLTPVKGDYTVWYLETSAMSTGEIYRREMIPLNLSIDELEYSKSKGTPFFDSFEDAKDALTEIKINDKDQPGIDPGCKYVIRNIDGKGSETIC